VLTVVAVLPGLFTDVDPRDCSLSRSLGAPSAAHPFGFDLQGCDYLAKTLYGARTSLGITVLVVLGTTLVALVVGSLAGYVGGRTDTVLTRLTDVWSGIPLLLGGLLVLSGTDDRGPLQVSLVLVVFGWPAMVRVLRASVLETRQRDFVTAARALGAGPSRLLLVHVLPHSIRPLTVSASAYAGFIVAAEATLTFAGVGLARPTESWGIQLFEAQARIAVAPHLLVFPALFLVAAVVGFVLLGEGLRRSPAQRG
jgi:oligopeptide transport system permease protein